MVYNKKILYYYNKVDNIGLFSNNILNIGSSIIGSISCGDLIKLQILVSKKEVIYDCKFKTYGCGSAIAVSSFISDFLKGKSIFQIFFIKNFYISQELNLPLIKYHCSILIEESIILLIVNYKNNYIINF